MPPYAVILDANFFLIPAQFTVDIYAELERQMPGPFQIFLPDIAIGELEAKVRRHAEEHKGNKGTLGRQLNLAKQVAQRHNVQEVKVARTGHTSNDQLLLLLAAEMASKGFTVVIATNDALLRDKVGTAGYATAWLRARKVVEVSIR